MLTASFSLFISHESLLQTLKETRVLMTSFSPLSQHEDKASSCVCFMVVERNQRTILRDVRKLMTYFLFLNAPFHFYPK